MSEKSNTIELRIKALVLTEFKTTEYELISFTRLRRVVDARRAFAYFMRKETNYTLERVGSLLNKDHATILHYCRTAKALIKTDKDFAKKIVNVENKFRVPLTEKVDWRAVVGCLHIPQLLIAG